MVSVPSSSAGTQMYCTLAFLTTTAASCGAFHSRSQRPQGELSRVSARLHNSASSIQCGSYTHTALRHTALVSPPADTHTPEDPALSHSTTVTPCIPFAAAVEPSHIADVGIARGNGCPADGEGTEFTTFARVTPAVAAASNGVKGTVRGCTHHAAPISDPGAIAAVTGVTLATSRQAEILSCWMDLKAGAANDSNFLRGQIVLIMMQPPLLQMFSVGKRM
jgi:hypothetical protein